MIFKHVPKNLIIILFLVCFIFPQNENQIQLNIFANNNNIHFLHKNSDGIYYDNNISSNLQFRHKIVFEKIPFLTLNGAWSLNEDEIDLYDLNARLNLKKIDLKFGSFHSETLYDNPRFSSGSMVFSNNAKKIYGIAFNSKWNNFFNLFEYKGELFQGKFPKPVGYDGGPYLHYKSVLLRKKIKEMNLGFAIQHAVQHGGYDQNNNKIPTSWENYINVFFARSGDESQPAQDQDYKAGNGLGAFTFILEKNSNLFYYEHYFDDKSGVKTLNFGDGLIGINLKFSLFNLNFELVNTRNQSGNQHPPGVDSYYFHDVYLFGWSNDGLSIGNSFIHPNSNRKFLYNIGAEKFFKKFSITSRYAYSKVYVPYQDKNWNQPYENYNNVISRKKYILFGLNYYQNEKLISIRYSKEGQINNVQLSYTLDL